MGIETNISDDALDALHERLEQSVKEWVRNSDTTGGARIERRVYLRKLLEEVAGELSACQDTLQREKDCQERFAVSVMGEERYGNSPGQAHPLELVELFLNEQKEDAAGNAPQNSATSSRWKHKRSPEIVVELQSAARDWLGCSESVVFTRRGRTYTLDKDEFEDAFAPQK